ncbi:hypothetical protein TEA_021844 [Camellia sinensis var. sinensis]|uniref:SHSP domain-containing protein n=1 Tax=Camellia sinensis var. sinensis TaxID=542762 RepID=A0A4S4DP38_CAMSN|nr:hypothetical protein TEA_021844 [Camellia sinensis var. sinensis]
MNRIVCLYSEFQNLPDICVLQLQFLLQNVNIGRFIGLWDRFPTARTVQQMMETMERMMEDPFVYTNGWPSPTLTETGEYSRGRTPWEIKEGEGEYKMRFDMPGMTKDDVKVYVEEKMLVVKAEKMAKDRNGQESEVENEEWSVKSQGRYSSRVALTENVEFEKIKAEVKDGVLYITIPKASGTSKDVHALFYNESMKLTFSIEETRMKIGNGVRMGWERRREKLKLQETCYFEWQNLIAEASRKGFVGEEEKQWDSYKILDEQLGQEWLESVEQSRKMARPKGSKRAPNSLEQRRKISEAISAKWADPARAYVAFSAENAYCDRVCTALYKYHGTPVGAERKRKRRPSSERQPRTQNPTKKKANDTDNSTGNVTESQKHRTRLSSNMPLFKDPFASSKLEMIKNIRAERAAAENKKTEAIERAKLLKAEAEKAAKALEAAATRSPLAQASSLKLGIS